MTRNNVDFPAPLVPSRATSPLADLEMDVEQDLHRAVAEVEVADLEHGNVDARGDQVDDGAFLAQLLDHPSHVGSTKRAA